MRRFASYPAAIAVALTLTGCGGGKEADGNALASLDTRLTAGAASNGAAADADAQTGAGNVAQADTRPTLGSLAAARPETQPRAEATQRLADMAGRPVGGCAGRGLRYGERWADAMPEGLGLYPGARLIEAAGTDTGRCALRVMSFTTTDSPEHVVAAYVARVRAAGFDAERQPCRTEIRLGGTRDSDDAAYMLFARRRDGVTEVDIVASAGRPA